MSGFDIEGIFPEEPAKDSEKEETSSAQTPDGIIEINSEEILPAEKIDVVGEAEVVAAPEPAEEVTDSTESGYGENTAEVKEKPDLMYLDDAVVPSSIEEEPASPFESGFRPGRATSYEEDSGEDITADDTPDREVKEKEEEESYDGRPMLDEFVREAINHLKHNFVYRKLGLVYDYVSRPGDFPRSTLPKGQEIRDNKPHFSGVGTGIARSAINTCLLLDGLLSRLELGLAESDEARLTDRLIAGVIRLGGTGPRGTLVRGITADGKSSYADCAVEHYSAYLHGLLCAWRTPTVAPESQAKLSDICGRMLNKLQSENFTTPSGDTHTNSLLPDGKDAAADWLRRLWILHIYSAGSRIASDRRWGELYGRLSGTESEVGVFTADVPAGITSPATLVLAQVALGDLCQLEENEELKAKFNLARRKIAHRLKPHIGDYKNFSEQCGELALEDAYLDWRADCPELGGSEAEAEAKTFQVWPRLNVENETAVVSAYAALAVIISGDSELIEECKDSISEMFTSSKWGEMWMADSLVTSIFAHSAGHELGLWDKPVMHAYTRPGLGEQYGFDEFEFEDNPAKSAIYSRKSHWEGFVRKLEEEDRKSRRQDAPRPRSRGRGRGRARDNSGRNNNNSNNNSSPGESSSSDNNKPDNNKRRQRRKRRPRRNNNSQPRQQKA